jgi:hypothetical protein
MNRVIVPRLPGVDGRNVSSTRLGFTLLCALVISVSAAVAHPGVPVSWWLDQPMAASKFRAVQKARFRPSALQWVKASCSGLRPRSERNGRFVYKHFSCTARVRLDPGVNYTFLGRVHVTGPSGKITLGG